MDNLFLIRSLLPATGWLAGLLQTPTTKEYPAKDAYPCFLEAGITTQRRDNCSGSLLRNVQWALGHFQTSKTPTDWISRSDNAYLVAESYGLSPELCEPGSKFFQSYEACSACVDADGNNNKTSTDVMSNFNSPKPSISARRAVQTQQAPALMPQRW